MAPVRGSNSDAGIDAGMRRHGGLDLLRFAAAFAVLLYHFCFRGSAAGGPLPDDAKLGPETVMQFSYFGLHVFFMISGFVILWTAQNRSWFSFSLARLVRLWPGYIACVLITAAFALAFANPAFPVTLPMTAANLTFFAPAFGQPFMDGVYWTIVLEIIFYFWVMVALFAGILPRYVVGFCAVWLSVIVINEFWLLNETLRISLITRYGVWFIIGMLAYDLRKRDLRLVSALASALAPALTLGVAIVLSLDMAVIEHFELTTMFGYAFTPALAVTANIIALSVFGATVVFGERLGAHRLVIVLGAISYPLYLLHQHIGYLVMAALIPVVGVTAALVLATGLVLGLAWLVWIAVERPVQAFVHPGMRHLIQAFDSVAARSVRSEGLKDVRLKSSLKPGH
ncbi:MAG: acyltransferase [Pseudomonadota bacterium]